MITIEVVWDRFCALLLKWDNLSLTRSTNLLESLGSTTVICCLDREGTIANVSVSAYWNVNETWVLTFFFIAIPYCRTAHVSRKGGCALCGCYRGLG